MSKTTINAENIAAEKEKLLGELDSSNHGILKVLPGNDWIKQAKEKPIPNPLYLKVWHEGELCNLFADCGVGKTVLSVQIGVEIAKTQKVLYLDFELSDKQFEKRYSNEFQNHFIFPENFLRAEINPDQADYEAFGFSKLEEYINFSIEQAIVVTDARVLIVDNITYLRHETEKAREALPLMKQLIALKKKYNLSILVLAHTPKRDLSKPITRNDLQGSKMLINFCDSCFALGESTKDKNLRYLKQIKDRNNEFEYDTENVLVLELSKPDNFLMFTPVHTSNEHEHLKQSSKEDKDVLISKAIELSKKGYSQRNISREVGLGLGTINKYVRSRSNGVE